MTPGAEDDTRLKDPYRDYWRENLERWAGLYDAGAADGHLENLRGHKAVAAVYRHTVIRLERRLLRDRLELCRSFIRRYVSPGQLTSDIGCGTGILTTALLARGARVVAVDFLEMALAATRERVTSTLPQDAHRVTYMLLDVRTAPAPAVDVSIAMGLAPYVADVDIFFRNVVLPATTSYCHFIDSEHWANRIRRLLPFLNVRSLNYTTTYEADRRYRANGLTLLERDRLGSGFLDVIRRQ